jgi:hypothetical protein
MESQRVAVVSIAAMFLFAMEDEEVILLNSRRKHRYWVAPYLKDRCNPNQRNTLAKLEMDFLRVSWSFITLHVYM